MKTFLFELCVENLEGARVAEAAGADRIELCNELSIGGVTPELGLIRKVVAALTIPVHVLIRPRGGDFAYSAEEFTLMRRQVEQAKAAGAAGVVLGILLPDGRIDVLRSRLLVDLARPMNVTFHRAFDETPDTAAALEEVICSGADCLLTSGGAADVLTGAESIARLCREAGERLEIMAGGGLRLDSMIEVARRAGVSRLHGLLRRSSVKRGYASAEGIGSGAGMDWVALEEDVRKAVKMLQLEFATGELQQLAN